MGSNKRLFADINSFIINRLELYKIEIENSLASRERQLKVSGKPLLSHPDDS